MPKGLWSSAGSIEFSLSYEGQSSFVPAGYEKVTVGVTTIDDFFCGKTSRPAFIQLDIEGAELEALIGAKNTITKYKPKLAICVYHKPEDIYEIPRLLSEYNSAYSFRLEQYDGSGVTDTILYAE